MKKSRKADFNDQVFPFVNLIISFHFYFLIYIYIYIYRERDYLNIQRTYVTAYNSTNNNVVFFFVSDLKIVYNNNW